MADFNEAQHFVSIAEGGYTNNPLDNGNWTGGSIYNGTLIGTNHGISAPTLCEYLNRPATQEDMISLPYETALEIYKKNYWDALSLSEIDNQSVALLIYDGAVNQGVTKMHTFLNKALSVTCKSNDPLPRRINASNQEHLFNILYNLRLNNYNPGSPFYHGWLKRLSKIKFSPLPPTEDKQ